MAHDLERAERIRTLKDERPDLTWKDIAVACEVTERAANSWARTGEIAYGNAVKLAEFMNADLGLLWGTPTRDGVAPISDQLISGLRAVEARLGAVEARLAGIETKVSRGGDA
jgi:hypothetical protein